MQSSSILGNTLCKTAVEKENKVAVQEGCNLNFPEKSNTILCSKVVALGKKFDHLNEGLDKLEVMFLELAKRSGIHIEEKKHAGVVKCEARPATFSSNSDHQKGVLSTAEKSLDVPEVPETSSLSAELKAMEEPAVSPKTNNLHVLNSGEECLDDSKTLLVTKEVFEDANNMEDESEVVAANNQTKISKEMVRYTIVFESGFWKSCVLDDYVSGDCSRIKRGHSSVLEQVVRGHSVEEQMGALQAACVQNDSERARQDRNAGSSFVQILQSVQDEVFSVDVVKGLRRTDEDARCISERDKGRAEGMLDTLWPCGKVVQGAVVFHAMMNDMHTESESNDMVIPSMYQGGLKHQRAFSEAAATLVAKGYDFVFSLNIILNVFTMCMIPRKGFCQPDFGGWNVDVTIPFDPGGGQFIDGQRRQAPKTEQREVFMQGILFDLEDKIVLRGDGNDVFSDVAFRNSLDDLPDWYYAAKDLVQIGGSHPAETSLRNDRVKNVVQGTTFSSNVGAFKALIVLEQIRYSSSSVSQQLGQLRAAQRSSSQFSPAQSSSRQLVAAQGSSRQLKAAHGSST